MLTQLRNRFNFLITARLSVCLTDVKRRFTDVRKTNTKNVDSVDCGLWTDASTPVRVLRAVELASIEQCLVLSAVDLR